MGSQQAHTMRDKLVSRRHSHWVRVQICGNILIMG